MPAMGPYRFVRYRGKSRLTVVLKNTLTGDVFSASATHVIPFDYDTEPMMIASVQQAMEEFNEAVQATREKRRRLVGLVG